MTFTEMHVKWSVILADRLGPEIVTMLEINGQVLHRVRLHLKVPGWLSDLDALLTRKLPMFLSRLNEISGGRGNMCLVAGSLRRILKSSNLSTEEWTAFINLKNRNDLVIKAADKGGATSTNKKQFGNFRTRLSTPKSTKTSLPPTKKLSKTPFKNS